MLGPDTDPSGIPSIHCNLAHVSRHIRNRVSGNIAIRHWIHVSIQSIHFLALFGSKRESYGLQSNSPGISGRCAGIQTTDSFDLEKMCEN